MNPIIPVAIGATVVVGGAAFAIIRARLTPSTSAEAWAHAAYSIWTGGEDCGQWGRNNARTALDNWYGIKDAGSFWKVIRSLREGTTGSVAWDQVRAIDLVRIGTAAGLIDEESCWEEVRSISRDLQENHTTWQHLASEFERGMHRWQDGRGVHDPAQRNRVQNNLPYLRDTAWPAARFDADLG